MLESSSHQASGLQWQGASHPLRVLSVLGLLARGRHEPLPEVTITRVDRVRIDAGAEVAYSDGERVGTGPFEIRVVPGALTLIA